jgi:hypothetical protein
MNTKEQWINETMESLDGIRRATGDPLLGAKIAERLRAGNGRTLLLKPGMLLKIAAGLALLITINVFSVIYYARTTSLTDNANPLVSEYFTYIKTINPEP